MNELFEQALAAAIKHSYKNDGMASVKVYWHPYEACWYAESSWSNNKRIEVSRDDNVENTLKELIIVLGNI